MKAAHKNGSGGIELVSVNEDDLYCAMLHLACMNEERKRKTVSEFTIPCILCKLPDKHKCSFYKNANNVASQIGIVISAFIIDDGYKVHRDTTGKSQTEYIHWIAKVDTKSHSAYIQDYLSQAAIPEHN